MKLRFMFFVFFVRMKLRFMFCNISTPSTFSIFSCSYVFMAFCCLNFTFLLGRGGGRREGSVSISG